MDWEGLWIGCRCDSARQIMVHGGSRQRQSTPIHGHAGCFDNGSGGGVPPSYKIPADGKVRNFYRTDDGFGIRIGASPVGPEDCPVVARFREDRQLRGVRRKNKLLNVDPITSGVFQPNDMRPRGDG